MADQAKPRAATFALDDTYPDAAAIFASTVAPIASIKDSAAIILDTNVLLVPFAVSPQSLDEIRGTYSKLTAAKRLFVPAQVAREFARNRAGLQGCRQAGCGSRGFAHLEDHPSRR